MNFIADAVLPDSGTWLLVLFAKSAVVLSLAFLLSLGTRKLSASNRYGIWFVCFVSLALVFVGSALVGWCRLEVTTALVPDWNMEREDTVSQSIGLNGKDVELDTGRDHNAPSADASAGNDAAEIELAAELGRQGKSGESEENSGTRPVAASRIETKWFSGRVVFSLWLSMVFVLIGRLWLGCWLVRKKFCAGKAGSKDIFESLPADLQERLGKGGVRLRCHSSASVPLTYGAVRPVIVFPNVWRNWSPTERKAVLLHEFAHIERRDFAVSFFCRLVAAVIWLNPMVWLAVREMQRLREQACDDAVIRETGDGTGYARLLTAMVRAGRGRDRTGAAIAMVGGGDLGRRINGIIDHRRSRKPASRCLLPTGLVAVAVATLLGFVWFQSYATAEQIAKASSAETGQADSGAMTPSLAVDREEIEFAEHLSEFEKHHLQAILENVSRQRERMEKGIRYSGQWLGTVVRDDTGTLEEDPLPTVFEVWTTGGQAAPKFRVDFRPQVSQWIDGASPWYIANETEFSAGTEVFQFQHDFPDRLENNHKTPESAFAMLPGVELLVQTGGAWGRGQAGPEGRNNLEICARKMAVARAMNADHDKSPFTLVEEPFLGENAVRLEWRTGQLTETWWLDPERGYALLGRDYEQIFYVEANAPALGYRFRSRVGELREIEKGWWFPSRGEFRHDDLKQSGPETRWSRTYRFHKAEYVANWKDSFFDEASVVAAVRDELSRNPVAEEKSNAKSAMEGESSGSVVNDAGDPVAGVELAFQFTVGAKRTAGPVVRADGDGRWQASLPLADIDKVSVKLSHPDYASDHYFQDFRMRALQSYDTLLDGSARLVIRSGAKFSGRVVDDAGEPVAGAEVLVVRDRHGREFPQTVTGADGRFEFKAIDLQHQQWPQLYVTVLAKGYAPALKTLDFDKTDREIEEDFVLTAARTLRLKVVDEQGDPIAGVSVIADRWRQETRTVAFGASTDKEGRIVWNDAPDDAVGFDILTRKRSLRRVPITAGAEEQVVVLEPALRVQGTVKDARSGEPLKKFRVTMGRNSTPGIGDEYWEEDTTTESVDGAFQREEDTVGFEYFYRIEAEGYHSFETEGVIAGRNRADLVVDLVPE